MAKYEFKAPFATPEMVATQEEMKDNRVPLEYRDFCAHLLIPLNLCRYVASKCFADLCRRLGKCLPQQGLA